jgi:chromosome segregation ATPase
MERMKDLTQQYVEQLENMIKDLREEKFKLEEENKNLKLIQETNEKQIQNDIKERDELREEIKKLSDEIRQLKSDLEECECSMHFENDEV